jgi:uncharacterized repeat protein (TIGR03806 family)
MADLMHLGRNLARMPGAWLWLLLAACGASPQVPVAGGVVKPIEDTVADAGLAPDAAPDVALDVPVSADVPTCATTCEDQNPCTDDACLAGTCVHTPNQASCQGTDPCVAPGTCQAGQCQPGPFACPQLVPPGLGASPCKLEGNLPAPASVDLQPWFTKLALQQPIYLATYPDGSDRMVAVLRPGQIVLFDNQPDVAVKKTVLDIASQITTVGEGGLLSVAFHPQFKKNHKFYVDYTIAGPPEQTIIAEFTMSVADPELADPKSKRVLLAIDQPFTNHKGGTVYFDNAGMLLVGMGDGGSAGDPYKNGQNPKVLLAKMLRIDVDHKANGHEYAIPADNPFAANAKFAPEIFAWGMRNPFRFSVDRVTGAIWVADVGQDKYEEVDLLEGGKNYGWNTMEATHCYGATTCDQTGLTLPIHEYPHSVGNSVTGGVVYRGSENKSLYGAYVFGDYGTGRFFALTQKDGAWQSKQLAQAAMGPVSFGEDRQHELYTTQLFGSATVFKLVEAKTQPAVQPLPLLLSQTKCFADLVQRKPAAGLLPYEVASPLWSDGAGKSRWIVLPAGTQTLPTPPAQDLESWDVPVGTLVIKHFELGQVPVETRFIRRDATGWNFFTYRWKPDGSDADLVPGGGTTTTYAVDGKPATWRIPTIAECLMCHKPGIVQGSLLLGVQTGQLRRQVAAGGNQTVDQMQAWKDAGLLSPTFEPGQHLALPTPTTDAAATVPPELLEGQTRAFLHANCSHCHRPGGTAQATNLDLRFSTSLAQMQVCGKPPQAGDVAGQAKALLQPGHPEQSALWLRMAADPKGPWFMPPVAVSVQSQVGLALVKAWIAGLAACP